ncbi:MAG: EAL domain-containing protein [Marinomonas sp.]
MSWIPQVKAGSSTPSNEIVLVEIDQRTIENDQKAKALLAALSNVQEVSAANVFLDVPHGKLGEIEESFIANLDEEAKANLFLVGRYSQRGDGKTLNFPVDPRNVNSQNLVVTDRYDWPVFPYDWHVHSAVLENGRFYNSFAMELAGMTATEPSTIFIDYRYSADDFHAISVNDVASGKFEPSTFAGKSVVFGYVGSQESDLVKLPKSGYSNQSFVAIFAAESLKNGGVIYFDRFKMLLGFFCLLLGVIVFCRTNRWFGYAGIVGVFVAGLIVPIFAPIYLELSAAGLFLVTFAGLRGFNRWRGSIEMRSGESGLPTLKALTRKLQTIKTLEHQSLVAAKLHGLSDAMAMLDDDGRLKYFEAIAARLKIANSDLELFANSGEHIVWHEGFEQRDILQSHLVALKAIFANPLEIGGKFFDVPVTFAADLSFGEAAATRISNVIALADKTSLAEVPILIGDEATSKDREWTVSLQSSIDAALKKGEIFPVFQPKVCLDDGSICGYEALVRWNDKERGFISPAYFIEQCEQAGRMGKLTQFMLEQSIRQYQASAAYPNGGTLAVNISSTMFSDTSLPQMVSDILDATGFPEERLVIEVTETARIHDPKTAKSVLNALASIGVGLSLDDFGTGTAGLETLYNYPFSEIKIDRAFIAGLNSDPKARLICNQVIELGNSLNMNVVAEGIEDLATMMALKQMGCPMMQGFYLGRPEVEPAIEPLVRLDLTGN